MTLTLGRNEKLRGVEALDQVQRLDPGQLSKTFGFGKDEDAVEVIAKIRISYLFRDPIFSNPSYFSSCRVSVQDQSQEKSAQPLRLRKLRSP